MTNDTEDLYDLILALIATLDNTLVIEDRCHLDKTATQLHIAICRMQEAKIALLHAFESSREAEGAA